MKTITRIAACLCVLVTAVVSAAEPVKLIEGTEVKLRFIEPLTSATAVAGQRFNLELDQDIIVNGNVIARAGAKAVGTVVSAHKRRRMGKAGELNVLIDYLLVGEQRVRLRASSGQEGKGRVGSTVALTVLFGPLGLLKRGKDVEINPGTPISAYVDATAVIETPAVVMP
jgi:hypothetical protein